MFEVKIFDTIKFAGKLQNEESDKESGNHTQRLDSDAVPILPECSAAYHSEIECDKIIIVRPSGKYSKQNRERINHNANPAMQKCLQHKSAQRKQSVNPDCIC